MRVVKEATEFPLSGFLSIDAVFTRYQTPNPQFSFAKVGGAVLWEDWHLILLFIYFFCISFIYNVVTFLKSRRGF